KALAGTEDVLVIEREAEAGGIPRHSNHWGYGVRDLRTVTTGPAYARRLAEGADEAGAELMTSAMVTGWDGRTLEVTSPNGLVSVEADAVVLATGARERPRTARRIPGDRPAGVYTTGELQNHVHVYGHSVGTRAVVVGSELVSWSAVMTLRHAGARTVLMTSARSEADTYAAVGLAGRVAFGVPVGFAVAIAFSLLGGRPSARDRHLVDHLRRP
ncbi:MAG: hypothetical protein J0I27_05695, partial [Pandoraea pnomenusa]|nr:hypothetical protein [Pandoraea pnomenusa]